MDEKRLRLGVQGLRLPLRSWTHQERSRLGTANNDEPFRRSIGRRWDVEEKEEEEQESEASVDFGHINTQRHQRLSVQSDVEAFNKHRWQRLQHFGSATVCFNSPIDDSWASWELDVKQWLVIASIISQRWKQLVSLTDPEQPYGCQTAILGARRDVLRSYTVSFSCQFFTFIEEIYFRLFTF